MAQRSGEPPRELSRSIIRSAAEKFGDEDDMSVYVVAVTKRE